MSDPEAGGIQDVFVLTRKNGEKIVIDGGIEITVVDIRGNQVRLGIEAPKEVASSVRTGGGCACGCLSGEQPLSMVKPPRRLSDY